eukprot:jgi/Ulvmu1/5643/UM231_0006.1
MNGAAAERSPSAGATPVDDDPDSTADPDVADPNSTAAATLGPRASDVPHTRLASVHVAAGPSPIAGGVRAVVWGAYDYYHYGHGGVSDRGWGCAYRSLQTLWSWFWHRRLTDDPPPTHRKVQLCLAKMGDKPASFVGSKQWIGAVELGLVLQERLGASYRILSVRSGRDVPGLAGELVEHFQTHGAPVMIGGGVLAYTLLGVDWHPDTGRVAFLILDPHYVGDDDVEGVVKGGWVAWKELQVGVEGGRGKGASGGPQAAAGGPLFRDDAFYNLLCPQLP